jgi:hypothetical protein
MIGYPFTYGDILEEGSGFTSETVVNEISEYWSDEINQTNFNRGYQLGLLVFGTSSLFLTSKAAFASDSGVLPAGDGGANCPAPGPAPEAAKPKPGSLGVIPSADRGTYGASALGICGIAMKTGAYWVGFVCAAAVIIGVRMASFPAPD